MSSFNKYLNTKAIFGLWKWTNPSIYALSPIFSERKAWKCIVDLQLFVMKLLLSWAGLLLPSVPARGQSNRDVLFFQHYWWNLSCLAHWMEHENNLSLSRSRAHCKDKIPKFRNNYSHKRNIGVSVPSSTFMRLWAIYIFPRSVSLFCWRKYVDRSWVYINR